MVESEKKNCKEECCSKERADVQECKENEVELGKTNREVICTFKKRMDTQECNKVEEEILSSLKDAEVVIFDLKGVEYVASSFLRICGKAAKKVEPGEFSVINVSSQVMKVFKISGLTDILDIS